MSPHLHVVTDMECLHVYLHVSIWIWTQSVSMSPCGYYIITHMDLAPCLHIITHMDLAPCVHIITHMDLAPHSHIMDMECLHFSMWIWTQGVSMSPCGYYIITHIDLAPCLHNITHIDLAPCSHIITHIDLAPCLHIITHIKPYNTGAVI